MRARYYNIDIKRFINQDVVIGNIDSSASLNRYAYVEGNPVSYLDPFGLKSYDPDFIHFILTTLQMGCQVGSIIALDFSALIVSEFLGLVGKSSAFNGNLKLIDGQNYEMISQKIMEYTANIIDYVLTAILACV